MVYSSYDDEFSFTVAISMYENDIFQKSVAH